MKILIAEDDMTSRLVLGATLKKMGHQVTAASNGREAWDALNQEHFPLLISDWMMPDMDGLELCRRIRASHPTRYTYIILLSMLGGKTSYLEGMEAGLHWRQEQPNSLRVARRGRPEEIWTPGADRSYLGNAAMGATRLPSGHPEGYLEAFANIYRDFAEAVRGRVPESPSYASLEDGIAGMRFIQAAYDSSANGAAWIDLQETSE